MRIVWIIPGSGESFYCENCLRDFAMLRALRAAGHDVLMVPMYLPLSPERDFGVEEKTPPRVLEGATRKENGPLFFGGINVYLQQKFAMFRRTPRWLDAIWDRAGLLRIVGRLSGMVKAGQLKQTLVSMLRGEQGRQAKELNRLCDYLADAGADVVVLSNALLLGLAGPIKARLNTPVACYLQDEDEFIDSLNESDRREVWAIVRDRAGDVDLFIAASQYYAEKMAGVLCGTAVPAVCSTGVSVAAATILPACGEAVSASPDDVAYWIAPGNGKDADKMSATHEGKMPSTHAGKMPATHMGKSETRRGEMPMPRLPMPRIAVVHGGIAIEDYKDVRPRVWPEEPVIGFLSRRCHSKGPDLLAEAFRKLKRDPRLGRAKLRLAGGMLASDKPLERRIRRLLADAGVLDDVEFLPHLAMPQRAEFLRSLSVLSVPERVGEAGGRYVKEALACGVPVVQPQNGCFPELLAATGGGLLFPPGDVDALTQQLTRILTEPGLAQSLGSAGQAGVAEHFSATRSADKLAAILGKVAWAACPYGAGP